MLPGIQGFLHCFLPLAEEVGHRVHVNMFAQVTTDRRRLRRSEHDHTERRWAFAQVEHGIAPAYATILNHLAGMDMDSVSTAGVGGGGAGTMLQSRLYGLFPPCSSHPASDSLQELIIAKVCWSDQSKQSTNHRKGVLVRPIKGSYCCPAVQSNAQHFPPKASF